MTWLRRPTTDEVVTTNDALPEASGPAAIIPGTKAFKMLTAPNTFTCKRAPVSTRSAGGCPPSIASCRAGGGPHVEDLLPGRDGLGVGVADDPAGAGRALDARVVEEEPDLGVAGELRDRGRRGHAVFGHGDVAGLRQEAVARVELLGGGGELVGGDVEDGHLHARGEATRRRLQPEAAASRPR